MNKNQYAQPSMSANPEQLSVRTVEYFSGHNVVVQQVRVERIAH